MFPKDLISTSSPRVLLGSSSAKDAFAATDDFASGDVKPAT
jgi:hypothetical protein